MCGVCLQSLVAFWSHRSMNEAKTQRPRATFWVCSSLLALMPQHDTKSKLELHWPQRPHLQPFTSHWPPTHRSIQKLASLQLYISRGAHKQVLSAVLMLRRSMTTMLSCLDGQQRPTPILGTCRCIQPTQPNRSTNIQPYGPSCIGPCRVSCHCGYGTYVCVQTATSPSVPCFTACVSSVMSFNDAP